MRFAIIYQQGHEKPLLDHLTSFLSSHELEIAERDCCVEKSLYKHKDFVLVIGGDGTFLRASHLNTDVPALGINPEPSKKEGFFMQAKDDWKQKIQRVLDGDFTIKDLLRLKVSIDGKNIGEMALNDIYIGDAKPYNMSNYDLDINANKEFQRSSGLIISTPAGSHAWSSSAGAKKLAIDARNIQYVPRELYRGNLTPDYSMQGGTLDQATKITISPHTDAIVVLDSISQEFSAQKGSRVVITRTVPLKYIVF